MLTLCALGLIKPSTQGVNVNPVTKGLMLTLCAFIKLNPVHKGLMLTLCALG